MVQREFKTGTTSAWRMLASWKAAIGLHSGANCLVHVATPFNSARVLTHCTCGHQSRRMEIDGPTRPDSLSRAGSRKRGPKR